ncbi:hypothetical protein GCM10007916_09540 [Psychromonas marina]|uniref:DUF3299 domain-containing protein n=1 Tax=Psychromonas marina TaxID=88364 RepID=A0ABQ6DXM2_9GAMM|nr:DUF3299 domain-containing protein [Psychromonas marina]GLS89887.1 hypothetical protein GCM10007916_09540 [Psychromonas marina]
MLILMLFILLGLTMLSIKKWAVLPLLFFMLNSPPSIANAIWKWSDLISAGAAPIDNPFAGFSSIQRYDLLIMTSLQQSPHNPKLQKESQLSLQRFNDAGIDILALLKKQQETANERAQAQQAINKALLGQQGKLAGYIVPLAFDNNQLTQFLLVPTAGACIHTPPPAANQIVLVNYPQGFEMVGLYTPIWIEGSLQAESNLPSVQLSDGELAVNSAYMMQADKVTLYR